MTEVTREELKAKIDRGERFKLVEALPAEAYREGHLPGAVNIPPGAVREVAARLLPEKGDEVIVYCSKFS